MIAPFELLLCLLFVFIVLALLASPSQKKIRIDTLGVVAVKIIWPARSNDDVDLYVQDPHGNISYFGSQDVAFLHLEYDDLGTSVSGTYTDPSTGKTYTVWENSERTVVRGAVPGEYVVVTHMYRKTDPGPTKVTVQLWRLHGGDRIVHRTTVVLSKTGDQVTAFRFHLNANGDACCYNQIPKVLVGQGTPHTPPPSAPQYGGAPFGPGGPPS